MENFALIAFAESLRPSLEGCIIRRVIQHQTNGFLLQTRSAKLPSLKLLMEARSPAFYPSESKPPIDVPNSDFLMVLRKHFTSAELIDFKKPLSERVVEFTFRTAVPSKELETMSLLLELIPNAPNIVLLDAERRVLSSFLPLTPQHGIGEFEPYALPRAADKIELERILQEDVPELQETGKNRDWLVSRVAGLGPVFADEILFRQRKSARTLTEEIRSMIHQVQAPPHSARLYTEKPLGHILEQNDLRALSKAILSPVELFSLERTHSSREFAKITEAVRFYFDEIESRFLLEQAKLPLLRDLRSASRRFSEKEKRLLREQKGYEEADKFQRTAQLLTTSGKAMDQRYDAVTVTSYFEETPQDVRIELDPSITLRENIDKMFKRHQKAGRGIQIVARQLEEARAREAGVAERLRRLQAIKDWHTWLAVAERISMERSGTADISERNTPEIRRFRTLAVEGHEILIGRNSRENDELTFRIAAPDDFWMHVADYSGSHVLVRNPSKQKTLPENVLTKAAQLAAYFSQARNSSKVEVHYTRRKNVSKIRHAKPGLVKLSEFDSIRVEPRNWINE
jgi:predicted ribosome quality control (RQC) complex YloA/Tae2 family protein